MSLRTMIPAASRIKIAKHLPFWAWRSMRRFAGYQNPFLVEVVGKYLPEAPVIVEAGANNGTSTVALWKQWPRAQIFAFEPVPGVFEQLCRATKDIPNVVCSNCALGEREEQLTMTLSSNNYASSSLLRPARVSEFYSTVGFTQEVKVPVVNLQKFLAQRGVHHVDLMWLDMQGYEPLVLASGPDLLRTVKVLQTEVNLVELYEGAVLYESFRAQLESAGLEVIDESLRSVDGDIICVRRDLLEAGWHQ